jgi:CspA family cold shock protein
MTGIIKSLIVEKNFGFITPDDGGKDIFFHASALSDGVQFADLRKDQKVSFDVEQSDKGPRAANVVLVA